MLTSTHLVNMLGEKKVLFEKYISNLDHYVVLNERTKEKIDTNFGIDSSIIYNP